MKKYAAIFIALCAPVIVNAQIVITEVMYDLPGSDSGREWVEIHNTGSSSVNLADWRFFEQDTNHRFQNEGDVTLAAGKRAIIADDVSAFKSDNPNINALVLDSSFSLKNTGEYIALKNEQEEIVDETTYTPQEDDDGEGASLQLINGAWGAYQPTPGTVNTDTPISSGEVDNNEEQQDNAGTQNESNQEADDGETQERENQTQQTDTVSSTRPLPPEIYAFGGEDRTVIVGADTVFEARSLGVKKEPLKNAQYIWNFGDGSTKEGQTVTHYFRYPGTYIVALSVVSGDLSATDHVRVTAEPSQIEIAGVHKDEKPRIVIQNRSNRDIHIGSWLLQANNNSFRFPEETFIARGQTIAFPAGITGLAPAATDAVRLLYPNMNTAFTYPDNKNKQTETQDSDVPETNPDQSAQTVSTTQSAPDRTATSQRSYQQLAHANTSRDKDGGRTNTNAQKNEEEGNTLHSSSQATATQPAAVIETQKAGTPWRWLLSVTGLVLLAIFGIVFIRHREIHGLHVADKEAAREARNYDIIETNGNERK